MKRLGTDLTSAQKELKVKHKAYENAVSILSRRLQEALVEKETAEGELVKLRAQVDEGGNNQALQVRCDTEGGVDDRGLTQMWCLAWFVGFPGEGGGPAGGAEHRAPE